MSLIKWEPFDDIDRFFNEVSAPALGRVGFDMAVDLYEEGNNYIATMNLPGVDAEKIDVAVEGNYLRVGARREEEKEQKSKQFYSKEIRRGSFERALRLPEPVNEQKVNAEYKDGVLKIILPKLAEKQRGKVKVIVKK